MPEPKKITAGLTYKWTRTLSDYPASDNWALKYSIVNVGAQYDVAAVADGDAFDVTIAKAASAKYAAGAYKLIGYVDDGTERHQIYCADLIVSPDFTAGVADLRSYAQKTLEAIEALLANAATKDQSSVMVDGQTLTRRTYAELLTLRDRFRREVASEERAAKAANGIGRPGRVQLRFR